MKLEIFEYIEIWYNRKRRFSALNYATIEEFNNQIIYKNVAKLNMQFLFPNPIESSIKEINGPKTDLLKNTYF